MSIFFSVIAIASVVNGLVAICRPKERQDINNARTSKCLMCLVQNLDRTKVCLIEYLMVLIEY